MIQVTTTAEEICCKRCGSPHLLVKIIDIMVLAVCEQCNYKFMINTLEGDEHESDEYTEEREL